MEYPKGISAENVQQVFRDAADLVIRPLELDGVKATAFFIDGLTSGSEIADFILHPISKLQGMKWISCCFFPDCNLPHIAHYAFDSTGYQIGRSRLHFLSSNPSYQKCPGILHPKIP